MEDERKIHNNILKKRTYAFTIDLFFIVVINKLIMVSFANYLKTVFFHLPNSVQIGVNNGIPIIHSAVLVVVFWSYFVVSYYLGEGRTPGKLFCGLEVVHSEGKKLGLLDSTVRTAGYFFCYALGIFLFGIPFLRKDRKGIPDLLSHTEVVPVSEKRVATLSVVEEDNQQELPFDDDIAA